MTEQNAPENENAQPVPDVPMNDYQSIAFDGDAKEYFGIWISNLFLSIVTLGIYTTWAKVRRVKYFYNNTKIDNFAFNYHATGMQLFKGRLIAFVVLVAYSVITSIFPLSAPVFSLAFVFAAPWLLNKSLRFSARMTSWRNIRLNWHGTYGRSLWLFVIAPVVGVLSLGALVPWIAKSYYTYYAQGHSFGVERFKSETKLSQYYKGFAVALALPAVLAVVLWVVLSQIILPAWQSAQYPDFQEFSQSEVMAIPYAIGLFILLSQTMFRAICRNILVQSLTLGGVADFASRISPPRYLWIEISNLVAMVCSLGLLVPWASVRRYRYLSEQTGVSLSDSAHEFLDEQTAALGAFGEEFADIDGLEVGI